MLRDAPQYAYTPKESLEYSLQAIKANKECKFQKKVFNLCRATLDGKLVDPGQCLSKAIDLVDCFQSVRQFKTKKDDEKLFNAAIDCGKDSFGKPFSGGCSSQINAYLKN
mmetsp:Transcript_27110/g.23990  ORF Transcript_27110/g.23990 Transcript_27110/m.23990 type:complete len:110 (-) Transcript_27110:177-506(-)